LGIKISRCDSVGPQKLLRYRLGCYRPNFVKGAAFARAAGDLLSRTAIIQWVIGTISTHCVYSFPQTHDSQPLLAITRREIQPSISDSSQPEARAPNFMGAGKRAFPSWSFCLMRLYTWLWLSPMRSCTSGHRRMRVGFSAATSIFL